VVQSLHHEILVVGGGIAGMESALTLGDMGYKVLLVEKEASIGGKMVLLSKVFPTLDCASCISTPKMAATAHHSNIRVLTNSEIKQVVPRDGHGFLAKISRKATYVDLTACTGCGECERVCTVAIPDPFNFDLTARRAAHIPYPQAVPKKALIERHGTSPCSAACPAGVKAHGFVSLVRAGKYREAFQLHLEDAPLPGCLSRACYAPCEAACTRSELEGPVSIRAIKRFMVDRYYSEHADPEYGPPTNRRKERVAIVGSGPAGLTAAYFLAREGYGVSIFEAAPEPGGMLRLGIPPYRIPRAVLDRDIKNIAALGVQLRTNSRVDSISALENQGFDAVFLAVGAMEPRRMGVPGEELDGITDCMTFLRSVNLDGQPDLRGKSIMMVGGGNACIDPARVALRLGAENVTVQYRRSRAEMPAHDWEVDAAIDEGVQFQFLKVPTRFIGMEGAVVAAESITMELGEPDESGRRRPVPVPGSEELVPTDRVIMAIGLQPGTAPFAGELDLRANGTLNVDQQTLQTSRSSVFAGGDVVTGPASIVEAVAQGKRAALNITRFLKGEDLSSEPFTSTLPVVEGDAAIRRSTPCSRREPADPPVIAASDRNHTFAEVEGVLTEAQARYNANRCLDCGGCSECQQCVHACPANAIRLDMQAEEEIVQVESVLVSTGFELFDPLRKPSYGYGRFPNVITAMQMDRILSPTRPYNHVIRPSDGKRPDKIAFVLCTGSRDRTVDNRLCSRVCCMYSIKQAQLLMGALPLADVSIHFFDIRAFGKGYEEFYQQAKAMGTNFVEGRVARIEQTEDNNLILHYEDVAGCGCLRKAEYDLVVLSVGLLPNQEALELFTDDRLQSDSNGYVHEVDEDINPGRTSMAGVFVAGSASAARDIPDAILHAGAAAAQAAAHVERRRRATG
jgi:heterodisulfide reductase subunit A-like polyferredoxin